MKVEDIKIGDVVKFKTRLLNKKVEDIGVVVKIIEDEAAYQYDDGVDNDGWFVCVEPFNLKWSMLLLCPKNVRKTLGTYTNFDFANDESNHDFCIDYEFKIKLTDDFFKRYIDELGYAYWNTVDEMKHSYEEFTELNCRLTEFWGQHMYHVSVKHGHDLRLTDEFIKCFST